MCYRYINNVLVNECGVVLVMSTFEVWVSAIREIHSVSRLFLWNDGVQLRGFVVVCFAPTTCHFNGG